MDRRCHVPNSARPVHVGSRRLAIIQLLVSYAIIRFSHIFEQHLSYNLYIAVGDGGGADDQGIGHSAGGNGQDVGNVLGAILGLDRGIGHFMLFEVDSKARAPAPLIPKSPQTSSAASDRKSARLPSSRQVE